MTGTYQEIIAGFKPQFGNANHIAAVSLIDKAAKLQKRLDGYNESQDAEETAKAAARDHQRAQSGRKPRDRTSGAGCSAIHTSP
jgi:hypothetical protein